MAMLPRRGHFYHPAKCYYAIRPWEIPRPSSTLTTPSTQGGETCLCSSRMHRIPIPECRGSKSDLKYSQPQCLLSPNELTSSARAVTSEKCQKLTRAALFETSSARPSRGSGNV